MTEASQTLTPLLSLKAVTKVCGSTVANDEITWSIQAGQIHSLIGENGAGKSTLVKILFGMETPDSGEIFWKNELRPWRNPLQAKAHGLAMVHQHFMQAENMTALEHFALETTAPQNFWQSFQAVSWPQIQKQADDLAVQFQLSLPWQQSVKNLSVGEQQRLEILKALSNKAELLILDEPTAVLSPQEVEPFLDRLLYLKQQGMTIILITHKLKEVLRVADSITILRKGKLVWTGAPSEQTEQSLAEKMIGESEFSSGASQNRSSETHPRSEGLHVAMTGGQSRHFPDKKLGNWNLKVAAGEIVGIAGVDGNGQDEFVDALIHPQNYDFLSGSILQFQGESLLAMPETEAKNKGRAWIPSDRLNQAALKEFTALENFVLGRESDVDMSQYGIIKWNSARAQLKQGMTEFDVRPLEPDKTFSEFSGGNQQKIVAAREFGRSPKWICACHPTRGIDILAARRIHDKLLSLKQEGASVLLMSADLDELFRLCDRIVVFYRGQIRLRVEAKDFNSSQIGKAMAGLQ